jgi:hypothetical protein
VSGLGWWSLWIGLGLIAVSVTCGVLSLVPVAVIAGMLGVVGLSIAGYDAIYYALDRAELRRRAAKARREREQGR